MADAVPYTCRLGESKKLYLDARNFIYVFSTVYEPAEDTWLAVDCSVNVLAGLEWRPKLVVDVGSGTGAITATLLLRDSVSSYTLMVDLSPCAALNSWANAKLLGYDALVDVAQCDNITCVRSGIDRVVAIYNTPYLPVEDDGGLETLAWSGGLKEATRLVELLSSIGRGCAVVVFSSLSGDERAVVRAMARRGFKVVCRLTLHVFFEDIVALAACKP